jgi:hypothetical protein
MDHVSSTWEERMSQRAKARMATEREAEEAAKAARAAELVAAAPPPMPGETMFTEDTILGDHVGHLHHWCPQQACAICSCGACVGTAAIVIPDPYVPPPPCEICKARKIRAFAT